MINQSQELLTKEYFQVLTPFLMLYGILIVWGIASYVISSISLYGIGKQMKIKAYGLAWVPAAYVWSVGAIADKCDERSGKDHKFRWALIELMIVSVICVTIFIVACTVDTISVVNAIKAGTRELAYCVDVFKAGFVLMIPMSIANGAMIAVEYVCYYKLIELCNPEKVLKIFLVGLLVPFAFPFVLLSCKKTLLTKQTSDEQEPPALEE